MANVKFTEEKYYRQYYKNHFGQLYFNLELEVKGVCLFTISKFCLYRQSNDFEKFTCAFFSKLHEKKSFDYLLIIYK